MSLEMQKIIFLHLAWSISYYYTTPALYAHARCDTRVIRNKQSRIPVWRDRVRSWLLIRWSCVRALPQDIYVVHCWLINPNKLNLLSWLLAYLSDKQSAWHQTFKRVVFDLNSSVGRALVRSTRDPGLTSGSGLCFSDICCISCYRMVILAISGRIFADTLVAVIKHHQQP